MEQLIAYCGLNCAECDAYIATKNNDDNLRKKLADQWSKEYNFDMSPDNINCVGCKLEGVHIGHCSMCSVRKCAESKKTETCAHCEVYPDCETLNNFLSMAPEEGAKKLKGNLDKIKAAL